MKNSLVLNEKEINSLDVLTKKYNDIIKPSFSNKITNKVKDLVPENIKKIKCSVVNKINENDVFEKTLQILGEGFQAVEKEAARYSLTEEQILKNINKKSNINIKSLKDIYKVRSYEIADLVNSYKMKNISLATIEGAGTGALGFAGIPFNIILSNFLYFRAIQSIAMFYGFDVKNDPKEMAIAGEVFKSSFAVNGAGVDTNDVSVITKIIVVSRLEVLKQVSNKTWTQIAKKGGIPLFITQLRAMGNAAAKKALDKAYKKGLEKSVFKDVYTQLGKKITKNSVAKMGVGISAIFGAAIDGNQMRNIVNYADIFYQKRFIIEKEEKVNKFYRIKKTIIITSISLLIIIGIILFI